MDTEVKKQRKHKKVTPKVSKNSVFGAGVVRAGGSLYRGGITVCVQFNQFLL